MKTKKSILIALFILLSIYGNTQIAIGPMIGFNFAEIEESDAVLHRENAGSLNFYNRPGFIRNSIVLGLHVDQNIYKLIGLTLTPSYTRKKLVDKYAPTFDLKYNIFSFSFKINIEPLKNFKISVGPTYNHLFGFNYNLEIENQIENHYGYVVSSSYQYKNFVFDLGFKKLKNYLKLDYIKGDYLFIESSKSFQFSINYMFEVLSNKE